MMLIKMRRGKKLKFNGQMYMLLPGLVYRISDPELQRQALEAGVEIHPMKIEKYGLEVHEVPGLEFENEKQAVKKTVKRRK